MRSAEQSPVTPAASDHQIMTRSVLPRVVPARPVRDVALVSVWGLARAPEPRVVRAVEALGRVAVAREWDAIHVSAEGRSDDALATAAGSAAELWRQPQVSIFGNQELLFSLRNRGCRAVFLAGGALEHHVDVSARDGADLGFDMWIVADGVEAEHSGTERSNLERLQTYSGVYVCMAADVGSVDQERGDA